MTLAFILIAIYAIGIKFTSTTGKVTINQSFTFDNIITAHKDSDATLYKTTYDLLVSALFFGALTSALALIFWFFGLFTKNTKLGIPGPVIDFTLLVLMITSITLAIAGSAYFIDKWLNMSAHKLLDYKLEGGTAAGFFIILVSPLLFLTLPLTCDKWISKKK